MRLAPTVSRLISINVDAVVAQIKNIRGARSINICQSNPLLIKLVWMVEPRSIVHRDFSPKSAVTEVWPVTHFSVANAHEIAQSIPRKVGQVDRLSAVSKN